MHTWTLSVLCAKTLPASSSSTSRIPSLCFFYCSFLVFMDDVCLPGCWPLFHFLSDSATNYISIFGSLFFFTTLHYSRVILINSVKEEGLQELLSSQVHFKNNQASHFLHFSSSKVLPFHLLAYLYIFFSHSPSLSDLPPPHHPPSPE